MSVGTIVKASILMGVVGLAVVAHFKSKAEHAHMARAAGLNAEQTKAFDACLSDFLKTEVTVPVGAGSTKMRVPDEVCVCHAKTMADVFKPGDYSEHRKVVTALTSKTNAQIPPAAFRDPSQSVSFTARLEQSVRMCTAEYIAKTVSGTKADASRPRS